MSEEKTEKKEQTSSFKKFLRDLRFGFHLLQMKHGNNQIANAEAGFLILDGCHPLAANAESRRVKEDRQKEVDAVREHWNEHGETPLASKAKEINSIFPVKEQQEINKKRRKLEQERRKLDKRQSKLKKFEDSKKKKDVPLTDEPITANV